MDPLDSRTFFASRKMRRNHGGDGPRIARLILIVLLGLAPAQAADEPATKPAAAAEPTPAQKARPATEPRTRPDPGARAASGPAGSRSASRPALGEDDLNLDDALDDIRLFNLEVPAVVTAASRREQKLSALPYAVSIITKEDLRRSGARNIPDALRLAAGVDVADTSYASAAAGPRGLHGYFARNTLMMVDGRQLYDALFGGNSWGAWPFMLEDIERIEVIRGPAGVTWGANAVNGVINIVTKDPLDQQGLTLSGGGGSRGVGKGYTGYGMKVDKLRLRASAEYERTDGFRKGGTWLMPLNDDYQAARGSVHAIYDATPNDTFTLSGCTNVSTDLYPTTPMGLFGTGSANGNQAASILGRWQHRISDDNRVEATAYATDFWASNGMRSLDYRYQQFALQLVHTLRPAEHHTLTYGFDSRTDLVDATNGDPQTLSKDYVGTAIFGLFVEDEWRFAPRWALTVGGRLDYECYGGFQPSGRISLSRELGPDSMIYGAVARGYQLAPAAMRFTESPMLGALTYLTADRDMPVTAITAYELGYRTVLFDRLNTSVTGYVHHYDDFMIQAINLGPPALLNLELRNAAEALVYGLEWEGRYRATEQLELLGNYTLSLCDWLGPDPYSATDTISAPRHKFMVGARYDPWRDFHLSAHMYYVGPTASPDSVQMVMFRRTGAYVRLDLRAEYEFWKQRASVAVGVRNLLDPDHFEGGTRYMNTAEVPRMAYAEMRIRLD